jgi:hypothetical protein
MSQVPIFPNVSEIPKKYRKVHTNITEEHPTMVLIKFSIANQYLEYFDYETNNIMKFRLFKKKSNPPSPTQTRPPLMRQNAIRQLPRQLPRQPPNFVCSITLTELPILPSTLSKLYCVNNTLC